MQHTHPSRKLYVLVIILSLLILVSRRPDTIFNAQFWAEDGTVFYATAYNNGILQSLLLPYAGYLHVVPRLIAAITQLFPLSWAPLIFNLFALTVQLLPVPLILSRRFEKLVPSLAVRLLLAFLYLALPNTSEIHANLTNVQWYLALLSILIVMAEPSRHWSWRSYDWLMILSSALSGPFAILLLPIAVITSYLRYRTIVSIPVIGLGVGALAQGMTILLTASSTRQSIALEATPNLFSKIFAGQVGLSALIGQKGYAVVAPHAWYGELAFLITLTALAGSFYILQKAPLPLKTLIAFAALLFTVSLFSATVPWTILWLPGSAARYWFIPMVAFVSSLVWLLQKHHRRWIRIGAGAALSLMLGGISLDWQHPPFADLDFHSHASTFEQLPAGKALSIPINPPGWTMDLIKH